MRRTDGADGALRRDGRPVLHPRQGLSGRASGAREQAAGQRGAASVLRSDAHAGYCVRHSSELGGEQLVTAPSVHKQLWIRVVVQLSVRETAQRPVRHRNLWRLSGALVLSGRRGSPAGRINAASVLPEQTGDSALFQPRRLQAAAGSPRPRLLPVNRTAVRPDREHRRLQ